MDRLIALSLLFFSLSCAVFVPASRTDTDQMVFHYESAAKVQLIGDWNNWGGLTSASMIVDPSCGVMESIDDVWLLSLPENLERGRYRYAFLVNGVQFFPDPLNPEHTMFFDNEVSVLLVD